MSRLAIRRVTAVLLCCLFSLHQAAAAFPGGFLAVGGGAGGGSAITTLSVVNDSASVTQAAGVPTQTFGMGFPDGALCSGAAPVFKDGTTVQPYSYGLLTYWPSGCLKFGSFMLLPTFSVLASGTHSVNVSGGGSWPAPSGRTIADAYAQNVNAQLPAASPSGANLTGTYGSWLDSPANTNNNNYRVVKWMDGGAGAAFKVSTDMALTKTGAPQGQLRFDHYTLVLNNSGGTLGGFRWLGMVRQPKYNFDTPAKNFRAFAPPVYAVNGTVTNGPNWQACVGIGGCVGAPGNQSGALPLSWGGTDGNPIVGQAFTVSGFGGQMSTSASNNYWLGTAFTDNGTLIPAYLTGGSLPSSTPQVDTSHIYWLQSNQTTGDGIYTANANLNLYQSGPPGGSQASTIGWGGAGSGTITPVPVVEPFTRVAFADKNGRYNFFQGTGTITAETTLRVQINQSYAVSTHTILPYDLSVSGAAKGGTVHQTIFAEPTPNWNPFNVGMLFTFQQEVGDHRDLGPLPDDAAVAFYNDTATDDLIVRSEGLAGGLTPADFKDATTDTLPNVLDVAGTNTYAGFPNSVSTALVYGYNVGGCGGYTCPNLPNWSTVFSNTNGSHKPEYSVFAYWKTGELQYLEMTVEQAQFNLLNDNSIANRNPNDPGTANVLRGVVSAFCCEPRAQAWDHRTVQWAAGFYPYDPSGTAVTFGCSNTTCTGSIGYGSSDYALGKYINDMANRDTQFAAHLFNPANNMFGAATAYVAGCATAPATPCSTTGRAYIGLEGPNIDATGGSPSSAPVGYFAYFGGEESNYQVWAYLIAAMMRQDANAVQWLKYWVSGQESLMAVVGGYNVYSFVNMIAHPSQFGPFGTPPIPDDIHYMQKAELRGPGTGSWVTTSPAFHAFPHNGVQFHAGDEMEFCDDSESTQVAQCTTAGMPSGFAAYTPYYLVNVTTISLGVEYTFDLSTTPGGTAKLPGGAGNYNVFWPGWYLLNTPPGTGVLDAFDGGEGIAIPYYAAYMMYRFLFGTDNSVGPLLTDITARLTTDNFNPATGGSQSGTGFVPRYALHY